MVPVGAARAAIVALSATTLATAALVTQAQLAAIASVTTNATPGNPVILGDNQTYSYVVTAVNNNIIRISGGALGFPVL